MTTATTKTTGKILIISTAILWGLAGICVKEITWNSMCIITTRSIISLLLLFFTKKERRIHFTKVNIWGGILTCATGSLYVAAIKLTTAGTAIVLQYIAPILVFLYAVIFCHRKAKLSETLLTFFVFGGCTLAFIDSIDMTHILGNLLALASGFTFAAQIIVMNHSESNSEDATVIGNAISFLLFLPFCFLSRGTMTFTSHNILWVLILGFFQYGLANLLFAKGIKLVDSVEASLLLTIEPIFNPIPVALLYGETMGVTSIVGAGIVIFSVALYGYLQKKT